MSAPSTKRFRFSLITLVVAVNVAGVLVWANMRPHVDDALPPLLPEDFTMNIDHNRATWGWPFAFREKYVPSEYSPIEDNGYEMFHARLLLADIGLWLCIILKKQPSASRGRGLSHISRP